MPNAGQLIRNLYRDTDGKLLHGPGPGGRRLRLGSGAVYGELTVAGVTELARYLEMGGQDVFYDIGSGIGKLVLQLACTLRLKRIVGIEIAGERYDASRIALERARGLGLLKTADCVFRHEDALKSDLSDATVVYTCSTCFPDALLYRLASKVAQLTTNPPFITLKPLHPKKPRSLELIDGIDLAASWSPRLSAYVYRVKV